MYVFYGKKLIFQYWRNLVCRWLVNILDIRQFHTFTIFEWLSTNFRWDYIFIVSFKVPRYKFHNVYRLQKKKKSINKGISILVSLLADYVSYTDKFFVHKTDDEQKVVTN